MNPIIWWFETISSLGSQSLGLTWVCWLQDRVLIGPSVCYIFPATKLENALLFVAGEFNIPVGMLKFVFGLLAAYPLALLIRFIPCSSSSLKHFIGAISGLCVLQFVFGSDWLHPVVSSIGTYLLFFVVPRKNLPMAVTLWSLGSCFIIIAHYHYHYYHSWPLTIRPFLTHLPHTYHPLLTTHHHIHLPRILGIGIYLSYVCVLQHGLITIRPFLTHSSPHPPLSRILGIGIYLSYVCVLQHGLITIHPLLTHSPPTHVSRILGFGLYISYVCFLQHGLVRLHSLSNGDDCEVHAARVQSVRWICLHDV